MVRVKYLWLVLAMVATNAVAEPSPTISRLMNSPVSAFTLGLLRLEMLLNRVDFGATTLRLVEYDWQQNRIEVQAGDFDLDSDKDPKARCREVIDILRSSAGVDAKTGKLRGLMKHSGWAELFFPVGYEEKSTPADTGPNIDQIFLLRATIIRTGRRESCTGRLLSTGISFDELPSPPTRPPAK